MLNLIYVTSLFVFSVLEFIWFVLNLIDEKPLPAFIDFITALVLALFFIGRII